MNESSPSLSWPVTIEPENPGQYHLIRLIHHAAFGQWQEADLVDGLRQSKALSLSLVAQAGGIALGHAALSPVKLDSSFFRKNWMGLAPVGVLKAYQKRGIGSALTQHIISEAQSRKIQAIFVLGDPTYYTRFGFVPVHSLSRITCSFPSPPEAFMVLELESDSLKNHKGTLLYPDIFYRIFPPTM